MSGVFDRGLDQYPKINFETFANPGIGFLCTRLVQRGLPEIKVLTAIPKTDYSSDYEPLEIDLPGPLPTYRGGPGQIAGRLVYFIICYTDNGRVRTCEVVMPSNCSTLLELLYRELVNYDRERRKAYEELRHVAPYQGPEGPKDR